MFRTKLGLLAASPNVKSSYRPCSSDSRTMVSASGPDAMITSACAPRCAVSEIADRYESLPRSIGARIIRPVHAASKDSASPRP